MTKVNDIENFIDNLARTKAKKNVVNPWQYGRTGNEIRRINLKAYLIALIKIKPTVLLVGEAPGYRGTCRTGVPFTSEKIILTHHFFTSINDFSVENYKITIPESSSSIVWKTLDELNFYPLIWASFPFHPHQPGIKLSNRAPTKKELILGQQFLKSLIEIYEIKSLIAIGRVAERTLNELNIPITIHIRHPSHGGAKKFLDGLRKFIKMKEFED